MAFSFKNKAVTYIESPLSSASTVVILSSGEGDKFPSPSGGDVAPLVLEDRINNTFEIVYMISRVGDQLNINRGQEATQARSWPAGTNLSNRATTAVYQKYSDYDARIAQNEQDIEALQGGSGNLIETVVNAIYPVGALYISSSDTNPGAIFGFGSWVAHAQGRALVGVGSNGQSSWNPGQARGDERVTLTESEIPKHSHIVDVPEVQVQAFNKTYGFNIQKGTGGQQVLFDVTNISSSGGRNSSIITVSGTSSSERHEWDINHAHAVDVPPFNSNEVGSGSSHSNVQPSIAIYVWRRTG